VCPQDTKPEQAKQTLCGPGLKKAGAQSDQQRKSGGSGRDNGGLQDLPGGDEPGGLPDLPGLPGGGGGNGGGLSLEELLDLPRNLLNDLPQRLQDRVRNHTSGSNNTGGSGGGGGGGGNAVNNLLDFLLGP